jgi:AbrB family looped-hinge helix DNA binding protein
MSTLTSKGQVTLPKPLRDKLGLKPGSEVDFVMNAAGEVVVTPVLAARKRKTAQQAASEYRKILESLRGTADKRFATTDEYMQFIRG